VEEALDAVAAALDSCLDIEGILAVAAAEV
jgi:hypothetical protein